MGLMRRAETESTLTLINPELRCPDTELERDAPAEPYSHLRPHTRAEHSKCE